MMTDQEYAALTALVHAIPPDLRGSSVYEVGAGVGGSGARIAEGLASARNGAHFFSVDNCSMNVGRVQKLTGGNYATQEAAIRHTLRAFPRWTLLKCTSREEALKVPPDSLAFVLIDGDHKYESALEDFNLWAPKVDAGGILVAHDIGKNVSTWGFGPTLAFTQWLASDPGWRILLQVQSLVGVQRCG